MSDIEYQENQIEKRPTLLLVVAILSLINIGWSLINNFTALFRGPMSDDAVENFKAEISQNMTQLEGSNVNWAQDFFTGIIDMTEKVNASHTLSTILGIITLLLGLVSVIFMLKQRKIGFHGYIIYSFLASIQIYFFVQPSLFSNTVVIVSLIISGIFVLLYGLNLKWMKF